MSKIFKDVEVSIPSGVSTEVLIPIENDNVSRQITNVIVSCGCTEPSEKSFRLVPLEKRNFSVNVKRNVSGSISVKFLTDGILHISNIKTTIK